MRNYISIFLALVLMGALITTSGCDLKNQLDDLIDSIPDDTTLNVSSTPSSLVENGNIADEIRGTGGNTKTPGLVITSTENNKYVNVALVSADSSTSSLIYLNSVPSTLLIHTITQGSPTEKILGTWGVALTPATEPTYYIYIWTTKEQYTTGPSLVSAGSNPTDIFNALTKDKTVLGVASSGDNKYYVTGK